MQSGQSSGTQVPEATTLPRLAIVVSHPIQHFCPMYRHLAASGRVDLLVIFALAGPAARFDRDFNRVVQWQSDITDGFTSVVVQADDNERPAATVEAIKAFNPDVIYLHGYHEPYLKQSLAYANQHNIPVMMTTDSELRRPRSLQVRIGKKLLLPAIFRKVDLFLTVGDANEEYFQHYGVKRDKFVRVPFSIDSEAYDVALARRQEIRQTLREKLSISPDQIVILNVGKLILDKGQGYMIRAFAQTMKATQQPVTLLIAGDGSERAALEAQIKPFGDSVRLLGFIGVEHLPDYYLIADLYAHPSGYDPHPLAISEAAYCGLPIICSDRVGSTGPSDDVQIDRNGWTFPYGDENAMSAAMTRLVNDPALRQRAGAASAEIGPIHASDRIASLYADCALRLIAQSRRA